MTELPHVARKHAGTSLWNVLFVIFILASMAKLSGVHHLIYGGLLLAVVTVSGSILVIELRKRKAARRAVNAKDDV